MQLEFNKGYPGLPEHPEHRGDGWNLSKPSFGSYFKPIPTKGVDYALHIRISQPTLKPFRRAWYPFLETYLLDYLSNSSIYEPAL